MRKLTRREFITTTGAVGTLLAHSFNAAAQTRFVAEKGAALRVLRWKRFVQGDEDLWLRNTQNFVQKTGIAVRVDSENWEEVRPKAAVAANVGAG
ncbi:MAG: ABC transporter substrate-binding protein, partial [Burkholderiales bacterium]